MSQDFDVAVLREETALNQEETMDLVSARELFESLVVGETISQEVLQQGITGLEQLACQLKRSLQTVSEYQEVSMMLVLLKILRQTGGDLPNFGSIGSFWKDSRSIFTPETVQKLEEWNKNDYAHLYALLQDSPRTRRRKKRRKFGTSTTSTSAFVVKWTALLTKMVCTTLRSSGEVQWNTIESTVCSLVDGTVHAADATAGMILAALDIVSQATSCPPTFDGVTITGLTPRTIYNMLQVSCVLDLALENAVYPVSRFQFLAHVTNTLLQYSQKHVQDDDGSQDAEQVCLLLIKNAFQNSVDFLLDQLVVDNTTAPTTTSTTNGSRKRKQQNDDHHDSQQDDDCEAFPFLVYIQVLLYNNRRAEAVEIAHLLERCSAISRDSKSLAWEYIMDYLQFTGELLLDGNNINDAYLEKRTMLLLLRRRMGNLGFFSMLDWYKNFVQQACKVASPQEEYYLTLAVQQTILKLLVDKYGEVAGVSKFLKEYPSLFAWQGSSPQTWALEFGKKRNPIPASLLAENGNLDLNKMWNRQQESAEQVPSVEESVPAAVAQAASAIDESVPAAAEQAMEQQQQQDVLPPQEEPQVEEIADSDDDEQEQQVEEILSSDEEAQEAEEISDSSDDGYGNAYAGQQQEQEAEAVNLLASSTEEEEPSDDDQHDEETADEDEISAAFGAPAVQRQVQPNLAPVQEAIDNYDDEEQEENYRGLEEGQYDSQEEVAVDGDESTEDESSQDEHQQAADEAVEESPTVAGGNVDGAHDDDQEEEEKVEVAVEREDTVATHVHIDKGYEPDTTIQTEEEDEDDKKMAAIPKGKSPRMIASRTTLSDMDAADERTEPSDVEDRPRKDQPTLSTSTATEGEASSAVAPTAKDKRESPEKEVVNDESSPFQPPAARSPVQPEAEADSPVQQIVNEVPKIDDVHASEEGTNATVEGRSEALSVGADGEQGDDLDEETSPVVDHVPHVEDARATGDDTTAAFAASHTGQYLSEAFTEVRETEEAATPAVEKGLVAETKESPKKKSGNDTDVGYMGDIEEKPSSTATAPATTEARSMQPPGYEADVEERSVREEESRLPAKPSPTARAMPLGLKTGALAAENDSVIAHANTDVGSVSGHTSDANEAVQPEEAVMETETLTSPPPTTRKSVQLLDSPARHTRSHDNDIEVEPSNNQNEEATQDVVGSLSSPPRTDRRSSNVANEPASPEKPAVPSTPPRRQSDHVVGSPASHTRSHDAESALVGSSAPPESAVASQASPVRESPARSTGSGRRTIRTFGSPASHTRSHDLGSPAKHTRSHDPPPEPEASSPPPRKKRRPGRPRKTPLPDDEASSSTPKKKRGPGRPRKTPLPVDEASSPTPKKRNHAPEGDESSSAVPVKKRSRSRTESEKNESKEGVLDQGGDGTSVTSGARRSNRLRGNNANAVEIQSAASPPRKRVGRPPKKQKEADIGSPEAHTRSHDSEADASPPKKQRGRPPKKPKHEAAEEEDNSAATRSTRKTATSVSSSPVRRSTRTKRKPAKLKDDESDDQVESTALTVKAASPVRRTTRGRRSKKEEAVRGKRKATKKSAKRDNLDPVPEEIESQNDDDDSSSISSVGSASVASRRSRRTARAGAGRESLSTIAESEEAETTSAGPKKKKASPNKRTTRAAARASSSTASTSTRATRSGRGSASAASTSTRETKSTRSTTSYSLRRRN